MKTSTPHGFVSQLMVYTLVMIGFSGSIGLGAVWLRHQISTTANATRVLDARIAEVDRRLTETTAAIEAESDPDVLLKRDADWHLGLGPPAPAQIVRMAADPAVQLASKRNRAALGEGAVRIVFPLADQR